jgi:hypothetical protein
MRRALSSAARTLWALAMAACAADHVGFRPRENVDAQSPDGYPAATYQLVSSDRTARSVLRIWSAGAVRTDAGGVLHVGIEIENRFTGDLSLDIARTEMRDVVIAGATHERLGEPAVTGSRIVPPDRRGRVDLTWALPLATEIEDVSGFDVHWVVADGEEHKELTPFAREVRAWGPPWYGYGPWPYWHYGPYWGWYCHPYW